ncbi:hypothetical protein [Galactobacter caseinivorans]|uniref:Integral membrane protein n=1 Tax=Galactobacter caseinivorans TaxID=2676123 RepID=A0A496PLV9_9MICC|nr:hypothetical protein [Galactobacter caseinivorans]RKW71531.1 hypothetical protein DWQ67_01405 [Galactobacter caseinivorans]
MRNVLAVLLAALAALSGASAWGGSVIDQALTQPQTLHSTLGPLIDNQDVRAMLATRVKAQVVERMPGGVVPKRAAKLVDAAAKRATDAVLDDPQVKQSWLDSLDESRELYVQRVRKEGGNAGRVEVVLDPLATLAATHVSDALNSTGVKIKAPSNVTWRLDEDISEISPVASLAVPGTQLVVHQSQYWLIYAIVAAALMLLALLAAKRRAVAIFTAGVVGGAAGLVGVWVAGLVGGVAEGNGNAVAGAAAGSLGTLMRETSFPVALAGAALFVLGVVMLIIGGVVNRRRSVDFAV